MSQHERDLQHERELLEHYRQHSRGEPSAAVDARILAAAREAVVQPQPSWSQRLHAWLFGAGSRTRWSVAFAGLATLGIGLSLTWRTQEQLPAPYDMPAPASAPALREMAPAMEVRKQSREHEYKKAKQAERSMAGSTEPSASFSASPAATSAPRQMVPAKPQASEPLQSLADSVAAPAETDAAVEEARRGVTTKAEAASEAKAKTPAKAAAGGAPIEEQLEAPLGRSLAIEASPLEARLRTVLQLRRDGRQAEADRLLLVLTQEFPQRDLEAELKRLQADADKLDSAQ